MELAPGIGLLVLPVALAVLVFPTWAERQSGVRVRLPRVRLPAVDVDRAGLRAALRRAYPWVVDPEVGPSTVAAGECDACGAEPRVVAPCGPPPRGLAAAGPDWALGRRCAVTLGVGAWCQGHAVEAAAAIARCADLPGEADDVARLWWVATGEVRLDPSLLSGRGPASLRAVLGELR